MDGLSRYNVHPKQAGVRNGILANKLGLAEQSEIDDAETQLLSDAYAHFFNAGENERTVFDLSFLFEIHRYFLRTLYPWAGHARTVDISKAGTLFAPVAHLDGSIVQFGTILSRSIPGDQEPKKNAAAKLSVIHNEFNALHPFRDGNGRTIRLFLDLMAADLGYNPIAWGKRSRHAYVKACIAGMVQDHGPMARIIYGGLTKRELA